MKLTIGLVLLGATLVLGATIRDQPEPESEKGWFVPQIDGTFVWMSEEEVAIDRNSSISSRAAKIKFYLYTRENPEEPQLLDASSAEALEASNFDGERQTRIIIHGWQNDYKSDVNVLLRDAYLEQDDYNVIVVDWSYNAGSVNYPSATYKVKNVGQQVAAFIDFAHLTVGLDFETLEIDGHSLGAHCAGFAGKFVKEGRVNTIRGMDPAGPLFTYGNTNERLADTDAEYVESIQTCGSMLGFLEPIGQAAFYPNGGKSQPGCGLDVSGSCAHSRSYEYLAEAILNNNFPSNRCAHYKKAIKNKCEQAFSEHSLGSPFNFQSASGSYYVPVNKKSPFGSA